MGEAIQKGDLSIQKILYTVLVAAVGIVVIRLLMVGIDRMLRRTHFDARIKSILRSSIKFVLGFVLSLIVLGHLNVEVTSLVALLSVAALAVSLAVQNLLSNVAGGLLLLSTRPFSLGDFVEADGVMGTVAETGIFYTKLKSPDNKIIQVPNSQLSQVKIINYSAEESRRLDLKISASYAAPLEQVKACILRVLEEHPKTLSDPGPMARVNNFGDSSIEYIARVWCANADYWEVYFGLLEQIKAAFDREGIEMTYNHLNLHIVEDRRGG